jgi:hypothetical protein
MKRTGYVGGFVAMCIGLIAIAVYAAEKEPPRVKAQVGRFQLASHGEHLYKMDTATGKVWMLITRETESKLKVLFHLANPTDKKAILAFEPRWVDVEAPTKWLEPETPKK